MDIVNTLGRRVNFFPRPRDIMESQILFNSRATMLKIPDLACLPIFEGKVNELIEDVFLLVIDIKNVRLIQTGQIAIGLRHAKQKMKAVNILCVELLLFCCFQ